MHVVALAVRPLGYFKILELETGLSNFVSVEETARQSALLDTRRASLQSLMKEWEEVAQALEANA